MTVLLITTVPIKINNVFMKMLDDPETMIVLPSFQFCQSLFLVLDGVCIGEKS
jgi:hypothetical protein